MSKNISQSDPDEQSNKEDSQDPSPVNTKAPGAYKVEGKPPEGLTTGPANLINFPHTDSGNAERLVASYGSSIRYCPQFKSWMVWDERRWKIDAEGTVRRLAKKTMRRFYEQTADIENRQQQDRAEKHARKSESAQGIRAMLICAEVEQGIAVSPVEMDRDPYVFNCLNGTIDLRSGQLREHRKEDLITNLAPVNYDRLACLPEWDNFLDRVTKNDADLKWFLRRAVGYSITADDREEVIFLIHGGGATGKSTFLEAIKATVGDYSRTADFEAFLKRSNTGSPRNDIARLAGSRMVISIEVEDGKQLAVALVKTLTGGDTVTARFLYKEAFEFPPGFKLWLAANHAPEVKADDDAAWRRILRLPFNNVIPKNERDPKLKAMLKNPAIAGPAILAWAVRGCLEWQQQGLGVPPVVEQATEQYRREMDSVRSFLLECCAWNPPQFIQVTILFEAYKGWCNANGFRSVSRREFNQQMERMGLKRSRKEGERVWEGLVFKSRYGVAPVRAADATDNSSQNSSIETPL